MIDTKNPNIRIIEDSYFFQNINLFYFKNIAIDSRLVRDDDLFIAIKGDVLDGGTFIKDAIDNGAKIVVSDSVNIQSFLDQDHNCIFVVTANTRLFASKIAYLLNAPYPDSILLVTGTNGKTSSVFFARQILQLLNIKSISVGTLGVEGTINKKTELTTNDPIFNANTLREAKDLGASYAIMEASSHGLAQYRLDNLPISVAAFTNIASEHLDYHINIENYWSAKKRLFAELLPENKCAVINIDSPYSKDLIEISHKRNHKIITYGSNNADISLVSNLLDNLNQRITLNIFGKQYSFLIKLFGDFQIFNLMCSIAMLHGSGIDLDKILSVIERIHNPPGRMNVVPCDNGSLVVVDYAHNADGLLNAINVVKKYKLNAKIVLVLGCGGNRDKEKRFIMGKIASEYVDVLIVTDDNPRNEDPQKIRQDIISGADLNKVIEIPNRMDAIKKGVELVKKDYNILLIAGKGHEKYQIINNTKVNTKEDLSIAKSFL